MGNPNACGTGCMNGAGQGAGEGGGCGTVCSSNCYNNCWGECDGGCDGTSSTPNPNLNENGQCIDSTSKGDSDSTGENQEEVNTCKTNGTEADGGQYGCDGRANNTCGSTASSNYCTNDCINDCATCADQCGGDCEGSAEGQCGCGSNCSGGCSGSCSGCSGSCQGGCQGSCKGQCNKGCTNQEQEENAKVTLDRIVNVDNVKNIYKFIVYEARRRISYYKKKDWEPQLTDKVSLLNIITANYPTKYNNILFSTTYIEEQKDEETGEVKKVTKSCEYIEKDITEPIEVQAYRDIYVDNDGKVQYGHKRAVVNSNHGNKNEIIYTDPYTFHLGTFHNGKDLENYFFDLNKDGLNVVYRYKKSPENKMYIQEYRYSVEKYEDYQTNMVFLLYYTIPRIFEETLNLMDKNPGVQSGTLIYDWSLRKYISTVLSPEDKHYADIISAKKWIELGKELYNEVLPIYDAR